MAMMTSESESLDKLKGYPVNRREFVIGTASLAGAGAWPLAARAQANPYSFRHGDFEIIVMSDGHLELPVSIHALDAPPGELEALLEEAGIGPEQVMPATNPPLIRTGSDLILVDTGSGANFQPTAGKLPENLAAAGIDAESITKVVLTHAHPDHVWGTLDENGALRYPNAQYYVSSAEWDFWMDPDLMTKMPEELHIFVTGAQSNLTAVKDRVTIVRPGDDIVTGITVLDSAGHTPGHISLILSGNEGLMIPADAVTEPYVYFPHPEWRFVYDMDRELAITNRKRILDQAATEKIKMLGFHWPYPGLGFAERKGTAYRYVPAV